MGRRTPASALTVGNTVATIGHESAIAVPPVASRKMTTKPCLIAPCMVKLLMPLEENGTRTNAVGSYNSLDPTAHPALFRPSGA
ncbi:MAG: hypothetical protein JWM91_286 [Rhodospirillales bacterium]|nr:hypothetical protein [Rhodospirillales bacterium]